MKSELNNDENAVNKEQANVKNARSTIEFPYSDLDQSLEIVKGVHKAGGNSCEYEQLAGVMGMEAKGGAFRLRVTNTKMFGLIDIERGTGIRLTELGKQSLDETQEKNVRIKAFLNVPLYSKVYEDYKGSPLPPPPALSRAISNYGVTSNVTEKARQILMRSAKQAGFFDIQGDRLIKPSMKDDSPSVNKPSENNNDESLPSEKNKSGGSGGGGDDLHPLIKGLFQTLPKSNTDWSIKDRANWLILANTTFNMLYLTDEEKEIKITINKITDQ